MKTCGNNLEPEPLWKSMLGCVAVAILFALALIVL